MDPSMSECGQNSNMTNAGNQALADIPLQAASGSRSIPLVCFICPKASKFSDISHLLTHVASKGHLQWDFKRKLSKDTDEESRARLERYNDWYQRFGIEGLLKSRSEARDQKQQQRSSLGRSTTGAGNASVGVRADNLASRGRTARGNSRGLNSTQSVFEEEVKCEPEDDEYLVGSSQFAREPHMYRLQATHHNQPSFYSHPGMVYQTPIMRHAVMGHVPMRQAQMGQATNQATMGQPSFSNYRVEAEDSDDESKYQRTEDELDLNQNSPLHSEHTDETIDTTTAATMDLAADPEATHNAKFRKGEWLNGMGVFDSASAEGRRKRNQKKDPSVLQKMVRSSLRVDQEEFVFDLNLDFLRTRNVYATPSVDGSVTDDDAASNKKQKKKRRVATKDVKARSSRNKGRAGVHSHDSRESSAPAVLRPNRASRITRASTRGRAFGGVGAQLLEPAGGRSLPTRVKREADSQFDMPIHSHGGSGGDVFRDSVAPSPSVEGRTGSPIGQRRLPGLALRPGNPNLSLTSPTPVLKRDASRLYEGKENNDHLSFATQSTSTSNPYFSSHSPMGGSAYNPLCIRRRDDVGPGFRVFQTFDENTKPAHTTGFQPINGHSSYDTLHLGSYQPHQPHQQHQRHNASYDI